MPPILTKPSSAAPTSLVYITIGALLTIWSGIMLFYFRENPPAHHFVSYMNFGLLATGITLLVIGLLVGPMSRIARQAELPPGEVTGAAVHQASNGNVAANDPARVS